MLSSSSAASSEPSTIKLRVVSDAPKPTALSSLRVCFEELCLPELIEDDRTKATLREYEDMLSHWESYSVNPPAGQIDRAIVKAFRKSLLEKPYKRGKTKRKRSPATVNKIMRTFKAAITPLWPADRHNPGGHGLIPFFKLPESLSEDGKLPFVFSRAEMTALYDSADACRIKQQPRRGFRSGLYTPAFWRAAMVLALNTGPRTWDLYSLEWDDIRFDDFKYGSIQFRARKTCKLQRVPLNKAARAHLLHLKSLALDSTKVFPGFKKNKSFYAAWKRIGLKAGLYVPFESFRKTCSTFHEDTVRGTGAWITGHDIQGVNAKNYQNPTNRVFRAIYQMKQPKAFRDGALRLLEELGLAEPQPQPPTAAV